jgi:hypothetical protein
VYEVDAARCIQARQNRRANDFLLHERVKDFLLHEMLEGKTPEKALRQPDRNCLATRHFWRIPRCHNGSQSNRLEPGVVR